ncbi:MAG: TetR/AcrR family transcriptional regulator [Desulfobulbaceae bacterium]|nr:MAG: TetR/AcrR family transcriptional regulator [Desulfobulbaceae bacterium]
MESHHTYNQFQSAKILESADALFKINGFDFTTIDDICEKAEIKQHHFFVHFQSVDEILEILWAR